MAEEQVAEEEVAIVPNPELVSLASAAPDEIRQLEMAEISDQIQRVDDQIQRVDQRISQIWRRTRLAFLLLLAGCAATALLSLAAVGGVAYLIVRGSQ
jgi:hypothetical protein